MNQLVPDDNDSSTPSPAIVAIVVLAIAAVFGVCIIAGDGGFARIARLEAKNVDLAFDLAQQASGAEPEGVAGVPRPGAGEGTVER
jgi:hypothetical protein